MDVSVPGGIGRHSDVCLAASSGRYQLDTQPWLVELKVGLAAVDTTSSPGAARVPGERLSVPTMIAARGHPATFRVVDLYGEGRCHEAVEGNVGFAAVGSVVATPPADPGTVFQ